ncbi:unnamed protein product [Allacma fusca]|uniref:Uncharacterized protein n=1 Tax=Allacma fusca TaxID=39272 RepID=A0A8J2KNV1_9HEXA|nr:unnamed protein product [Allacma fusca]
MTFQTLLYSRILIARLSIRPGRTRLNSVKVKSKLDERVNQATRIFEARLVSGLRSLKIPEKYVDQHLATVLLVNASIDIGHLEAAVENFTGTGRHKNDAFYDVQHLATKLQITLDSIDVSDCKKVREIRYDLYSRLTNLSATLESRIHQGHSECDKCVQVKIVMPSITTITILGLNFYTINYMMASREISREVDFIVTVNNETLELNSGALSCFSSEPETNTPIAFVSVIGQPMSRKTSLISQTLRYVRERAGVALGDAHSGFPNETDEKVSLLQHDDRQGVLMWTKPVWITNDDQMLGWTFASTFHQLWYWPKWHLLCNGTGSRSRRLFHL